MDNDPHSPFHCQQFYPPNHLVRAILFQGWAKAHRDADGMENPYRHPDYRTCGPDGIYDLPAGSCVPLAVFDPKLVDVGYDAFKAGRPLSANPCNPGTPDHDVWKLGWSTAKVWMGR